MKYQLGIIFKSNIKNKPMRTTTPSLKHVLRLQHLDIGLSATAYYATTFF